MDRLVSIIKSLEKIGLTKQAEKLKQIDILYKTSAVDYSKEINIINQLIEIINTLKDENFNKLGSGLSFPSYSIESSNRHIVYNQEDLSPYQKKDIMKTGFPNYLKTFVNKYMKAKSETVYSDERRKYSAVMSELEDLAKQISKAYQEVLAPTLKTERVRELSTQSLNRERTSLQNIFTDINIFKSKIRSIYLPKLKDTPKERSKFFLSEDEADLDESAEDQILEDEYSKSPSKIEISDIKKKFSAFTSTVDEEDNINWAIEELENLEVDFTGIKEEVDNTFAKQLSMPVENFRDFFNVDRLLARIQRTGAKSDNSNMKIDFQDIEQEYYGDLASREASLKKIIRDISRGIIGKKDRRGKIKLYSPEDVLKAWESLLFDLKTRYEVFVETIIYLTHEKEKLKQVSQQQKQEQQKDTEQYYFEVNKEYIRSIDDDIENRLKKIIRVLEG